MNVDNMNLLIEHLERIPNRAFRMEQWLQASLRKEDSARFRADSLGHERSLEIVSLQRESGGRYVCNTTGCIGGYAVLIRDSLEPRSLGGRSIDVLAQEWLGISNSQAYDLFHGGGEEQLSSISKWRAVRTLKILRDTGEVRYRLTAKQKEELGVN